MKRLINNNLPKWIVFAFDAAICTGSLLCAFLLRYNFDGPSFLSSLPVFLPLFLVVRLSFLLIFGINKGIIRYATFQDAERIIISLALGSAVLVAYTLAVKAFSLQAYLSPLSGSLILIEFALTAFLMVSSRVIIKGLFWKAMDSGKERTRVVILGSGQKALTAKETIERAVTVSIEVIAFIDSGDSKDVGKKIDGLIVHDASVIDELINDQLFDMLVVAKSRRDQTLITSISGKCVEAGLKVLTVPEPERWINGELSFNQIKKIPVEDLLNREPINLDKANIIRQVSNGVVMVTGAAGSIGSEIVRQLCGFNPQEIILVDQAETPLYEIDIEVREGLNFHKVATYMSDITNKHYISTIFEKHKPSIVFHAAAYKHVPLVEEHPIEGFNNNVLGTKTLADLSNEFGVDKFVMVSTDKAVNPTNVMGATKRIAEMYCQSLNEKSETQYITTRFGNVLGSNGSVIPRFKEQIENGGPVTVTHPEITRFFMTIPEACQLVLEAGAMGGGGEIFVFDMGNSVKIFDLAKQMVRLSGLELGRDIEIKFTGLRPGEKLYEELLSSTENTLPTYNKRILLAKTQYCCWDRLNTELQSIEGRLYTLENIDIVRKIKKLVPEYISQNSVYEIIDIEINEKKSK